MRPVEFKVKVVKIGSSLRMTIPKEVCVALGVKAGDTVAVSVVDGEFRVRKARKS